MLEQASLARSWSRERETERVRNPEQAQAENGKSRSQARAQPNLSSQELRTQSLLREVRAQNSFNGEMNSGLNSQGRRDRNESKNLSSRIRHPSNWLGRCVVPSGKVGKALSKVRLPLGSLLTESCPGQLTVRCGLGSDLMGRKDPVE